MSRYTLGVDTSNYATSLAVFDTAGEVVCAKKRFLPVKAGQLGLRQSDALFHHTAALPGMLQELAQEQPRLRVINLAENQGKALALKAGAAAARGDLLVCIDGDALLDRDTAAYLVAPLIQYPHVGAVTGNPRVDSAYSRKSGHMR